MRITASAETREALERLRSSYILATERQVLDAVLGADAVMNARSTEVGSQLNLDEIFF